MDHTFVMNKINLLFTRVLNRVPKFWRIFFNFELYLTTVTLLKKKMEMIQLFLVGLCCTTLKDQLRRVVNVSAFRLIQYRKSKTKVLIFTNQSAGEYHQEPMRTQGQQNTIDQLASDFGLNLIGWESGAKYPDQSHRSKAKSKCSWITFDF